MTLSLTTGTNVIGAWGPKDPNDANDAFAMDFSAKLAEQGDTIVPYATVSIAPSGVSVLGISQDTANQVVGFRLGGGLPDVVYTVTVTITTTSGRIISRSGELPVQRIYSR